MRRQAAVKRQQSRPESCRMTRNHLLERVSCGIRKQCLGVACSEEEFDQWCQTTLQDKLTMGYHVRESLWSECVAVGDEDWLINLVGRVNGIGPDLIRYEFPNELGEDKVSYGLKVSRRAQRGPAAGLAGESPDWICRWHYNNLCPRRGSDRGDPPDQERATGQSQSVPAL